MIIKGSPAKAKKHKWREYILSKVSSVDYQARRNEEKIIINCILAVVSIIISLASLVLGLVT